MLRRLLRRRSGSPALARGLDPLAREIHTPPEVDPGPVTRMLFGRLDGSDRREMEARLTPEQTELWRSIGSERERMQIGLALALHHVPAAAGKTGLSAADPPEGVHAMARGPLATGGAYYYADLVAEALGSLDGVRSGLDFGCSSGRVVRVLAAAYPDVEWHGCDPNEDAIAWASDNLPGVDFRVSGEQPPLPYREGSLDLVVSVAVFAMMGPAAAARWFEEMRRVIRPGGRLLVTTHGWHTLHWLASRELWAPEDVAEAAAGLYARGYAFKDIFGEEGDWGVRSPEWGFGFMSPEWIGLRLLPRWSLLDFKPGRVEENNDLVLLERRS